MNTTTHLEDKIVYLADAIDALARALAPAPPAPDWSLAPAWANWHAYDLDGRACWYGKRPRLPAYDKPGEEDLNAWQDTGKWAHHGEWGRTVPHWELTLTRRPPAPVVLPTYGYPPGVMPVGNPMETQP